MSSMLSALRTGHILLPGTLFFCLLYSFMLEAEWTPGPNAAGRIRYIKEKGTSLGIELAAFRLVA
jgi:hypothetical protein